jgi:multidrug efflux system membrane fusion protein
MSVKSSFFALVAVAAGLAAYAIYAPERVDGVSPQAATLARAARARAEELAPQAATLARAAFARLTARRASAEAPPARAEAPPASAQSPAVPVEAAIAARKDFPVVLEELGQVAAYNTVTVRARVDGQIDRIAFKEGQMVKKGDLLAEIDPRPFKAALDQAVAKKAQDEANLANARLDLERYSTLVKQNFATRQQFDTQTSLVSQLIAAVAADTAAVEAASVQLGYTRITAPLAGRLGYRLIDQGNMVAASQQTGVVVINELQPIAVTFPAPEEAVGEINALMKGGDAKVVAKSTDGKPLATGVLEVVDNQIDLATGTVKLKARFDNADNHLWPGLAVIADLTLGLDRDAVVVPTEAVQHGVSGLFVYVIGDDNKATPRPVKVAHQNPRETEIAEGLKGGERVVTAGQALLRPGALVAVQAGPSRS